MSGKTLEPQAVEIDKEAIDLVRKARTGDPKEIRHLYTACTIVHSYILARYRDPVFAKEIFYDTVTEIWRGKTEYQGQARFTTWAIGIARHLAATAQKKRGLLAADLPCEPSFDNDILTQDDEPASPHDGTGTDPFDAMVQNQQRDNVLTCIRKLSPKLGEALLLVYYAEMSQADIAGMLELNINTVKTRVRDAHLKIKNCLNVRVRGRYE